MLLSECYEAFGGDYESVKQRISSDAIIKKFVLKFLTEPSYSNLCNALDAKEYEGAFRAAHSLKGVCANLGFQNLWESSGNLTELLRNCVEESIDVEECNKYMECVSREYEKIINAIRKFEQEQ